MANADFEQNTPRGGFDAGSYRAEKAQQPVQRLTPAQQKLADIETKLPHALQSRAAASTVAGVMLVLAVFGLGGAKLNTKYQTVQNAVTVGVAEDTRYNSAYTLAAQLSDRAGYAKSMLTAAADALGTDNSYLKTATDALDALNAARQSDSVRAMHDADATLEAAMDAVYAEAQSRSDTPMDMGALQNAYTNYNSAGRILLSLHYNDLAQEYNDSTGFPANVIGAPWGCGKAELFA